MCGIFAAVTKAPQPSNTAAWIAVNTLHHRGPDSKGVETTPLEWGTITLGMARLKIVDQSDLVVPYSFPSLQVSLAFNGEIYNWKDLRHELGGEWSTNCDAEVIAAAWRKFGPECLNHFNGMWGFVLVDHLRNEVFIARDRAGEKPVYYTLQKDALFIASEVKALPIQLQECECSDLECLEFDCGWELPIEGVHALEPGHYIHLSNGEIHDNRVRWWVLNSRPDPSITAEEALDELRWTLQDAIRIRYVSEVPVAVQLSGGLDSAIVQAVCQSDRLYCVDFSTDGVDNLTAAEAAAVSRPVIPVTFTKQDLLRELPQIVYHLDTPATWSAVCLWFMNRKIAQDDNVVVLSGEGADELFGGYSRYRVLWWLDRLKGDPLLEAYLPLIKRTLQAAPEDSLIHMLDRSNGLYRDRVEELIKLHSPQTGDLVADMAQVDFYTTMQVLLRMADRMAAAFSLENRSPFFDYRLMELAARLPTRFKISKYRSKVFLRLLAEQLGVPRQIIEEKTKKGLFIPQSWAPKSGWDRSWFKDAMISAWEEKVLRRCK